MLQTRRKGTVLSELANCPQLASANELECIGDAQAEQALFTQMRCRRNQEMHIKILGFPI